MAISFNEGEEKLGVRRPGKPIPQMVEDDKTGEIVNQEVA